VFVVVIIVWFKTRATNGRSVADEFIRLRFDTNPRIKKLIDMIKQAIQNKCREEGMRFLSFKGIEIPEMDIFLKKAV
jgi:hypothetical protein